MALAVAPCSSGTPTGPCRRLTQGLVALHGPVFKGQSTCSAGTLKTCPRQEFLAQMTQPRSRSVRSRGAVSNLLHTGFEYLCHVLDGVENVHEAGI